MKTNTTLPATGIGNLSRLLTAFLLLALSLGTAPKALAASGFFNDYIIASGSGTSNGGTYYYRANANFNNPFQGANLGTYDRASGTLGLGGQASTFQNGGDNIKADSTILFFRVYRQLAANGDAGQGYAFRGIKLNPEALQGNNDRRYETVNGIVQLNNQAATTVNLVSFTSGPGVYVVEVFMRAIGTNGGTRFKIFDSNSSANYKATFTVTSATLGQAATIWRGGDNPGCTSDNSSIQSTAALVGPSNWFDPANWSNGVPTQVTDVEVPNYSTNPCVVYPNIRGNAQTGPAFSHDLTMRGANPSNRSIVRLVTGELMVFGNVLNPADSYIQRSGTTYTLAGFDQTFDGSQTFTNFVIAGGGHKTLTGSMQVANVLNFVSGVLVTGAVNSTNTNVTLQAGARLTGETESNYVEGIVIDTEAAVPGVNQDFGGIGLDLTFTGGNPGSTRVTRTTGFSASGLAGSKPGIKRTFGIQPTNATGPGNVLVARMGVRYLDRDHQQVSNGLSPTAQNLDETQLVIYISTNGGVGLANVGRDRINTSGNRVTQNGITTFATTTLGENGSTLPVSFIYFTAGRHQGGAALTWGTAQEKDNAGFEVQVSRDGREFRTLTTIKPVSANSSSPRHYTYQDATSGSGTVYYRLRQVDTDGVYVYTPVRTVNFEGASLESSTSSVFPNPFNDGEQLMLTLDSEVAGAATVSITDALGREVARNTVELPRGGATLPLPSLNGKPAGMYLVHLVLPSGTTKAVKVQKQ